jgi:hypothetical protein
MNYKAGLHPKTRKRDLGCVITSPGKMGPEWGILSRGIYWFKNFEMINLVYISPFLT